MSDLSRRELLQSVGLGMLAAYLGGCDPSYPAEGTAPRRDAATVARPDASRDAGANVPDAASVTPTPTDFEVADLVALPNSPTPASIRLWGNDKALVVSSSPWDNAQHFKGTVGFDLPGALSIAENGIAGEGKLYLGDAAALQGSGGVIAAERGFIAGALTANPTFIPLPEELNSTDTYLIPGAVLPTGDALWVTATAFHAGKWSRREDPFVKGFLIAYPLSTGGDVTDAPEAIELDGTNPTGMAVRGEGAERELVILNSGNHLRSSRATIDFVSTQSRTKGNPLELPVPEGYTMQLSPRLAIDEVGEPAAVIGGTSENDGRAFRIGLDDGLLKGEATVAGEGFHSSTVLAGSLAFVTAHGPVNQIITMLQAQTVSFIKSRSLNPSQQLKGAGMSMPYGNLVLQAMHKGIKVIRPI
jgi:hypothetical protein